MELEAAGLSNTIGVKSMSNIQEQRIARAGNGGGKSLSLNDLPPSNTKRWVIRRKAEVVAGVRSGIISLEEACERYTLSIEEFLSWQRLIDSHGVRGLRATRLQDYRANSRPAE
ncbi:MAG: hypothetical protein RL477_2076 [Pseudomonadota bacterium]|jgi:hypothetical protein